MGEKYYKWKLMKTNERKVLQMETNGDQQKKSITNGNKLWLHDEIFWKV